MSDTTPVEQTPTESPKADSIWLPPMRRVVSGLSTRGPAKPTPRLPTSDVVLTGVGLYALGFVLLLFAVLVLDDLRMNLDLNTFSWHVDGFRDDEPWRLPATLILIGDVAQKLGRIALVIAVVMAIANRATDNAVARLRQDADG